MLFPFQLHDTLTWILLLPVGSDKLVSGKLFKPRQLAASRAKVGECAKQSKYEALCSCLPCRVSFGSDTWSLTCETEHGQEPYLVESKVYVLTET